MLFSGALSFIMHRGRGLTKYALLCLFFKTNHVVFPLIAPMRTASEYAPMLLVYCCTSTCFNNASYNTYCVDRL
jgi:hypothetical protein